MSFTTSIIAAKEMVALIDTTVSGVLRGIGENNGGPDRRR